ncbi:MAG: cupin domain-containing protein [Geminicoccaceae bacterium]
MSDAPKHLVRTGELDPAEAVVIRHPFNPNSEVSLQRLAERTGMGRVIVTMARVQPGKESFILHAHLQHEEFVYILEGRGTAVIGDREIAVGPGDFMGFPIDGTAHTLRNTGVTDLVYLMGGERGPLDDARYPSIGKTVIYSRQDGIRVFDDAGATELSLTDFVAKD